MTIHIRKRPLKGEGRYALFLEFYSDKKQWQENLKMYLENEKGNPTAKQMNKQTLQIAEQIKVKRLYQFQNDIHGFNRQPSKTYLTFNEYFCKRHSQSMAQCALCTKTAQQLGDGPATGLNKGMMYLMFIPLALLFYIGYRWYKREQLLKNENKI